MLPGGDLLMFQLVGTGDKNDEVIKFICQIVKINNLSHLSPFNIVSKKTITLT